MNKNIDIDKLRLLLHKYYEAATSQEEEKLIMYFFSETKSDDIPQDLTVDRMLFSSIKDLQPCDRDLKIPDDLLGKINRELTDISLTGSKGTKKKWKIPLLYAGTAAIACVVLALGIRYITISSIHNASTVDYVAETPSAPTEDAPSITSDPFEAKTVLEPSEQKPSTKSTTPLRNKTVAAIEVSTDVDEGYTEITDPEEAREIMLEISRLLANNSQKTNEAIRMVENTVNEYREITKSILQ